MSGSYKCKRLFDMGTKRVILQPLGEIKEMPPREFVTQILVKRLNAGFVCCGYNFHFGKNGAGDSEMLSELCEESSVVCEICPPVCVNGEPVSSSAIRKKIESGDVKGANALLGYDYTIDFEVVSGRRLGRILGTPTINQLLPEDFVKPRYGVYASYVLIDGKRLPGVTNIGIKPTLGGTDAPVCETWIMDYDGDLYGRNIETSLLHFVRPEMKFAGLNELKEQILADGKKSREIFEKSVLRIPESE